MPDVYKYVVLYIVPIIRDFTLLFRFNGRSLFRGLSTYNFTVYIPCFTVSTVSSGWILSAMSGNANKSIESKATKSTGRKALLAEYIEKQVTVITNDGRNIVGWLYGFDQVCNLILERSFERVFANEVPVRIVALGLYVIRGDNIAVVGEIDSEKDDNMDWEKVKVSSIPLDL